MNIQHLRHFVVTADTGNMLKAAETLNISQSGLSRSVGALENLLGLPLFERSAKGVELTAFGRQFYPHARLMLNEYNRSMDELKTYQNLKGGSLRIGINHSFAYVLIPGVIAELVRRWPGIHVDIESDNYAALVSDLSHGDIDIAFSLYTTGSMHDHLDYEPLFDIRTRVFARADHPLRDSKQIGPKELAAANWCLINGASVQSAFSAFFTENGLEPPPVAMQCSSVALMASVVAQSNLLTILPEELIQKTRGFSIEPLQGFDFTFGVAHVGLVRRKGSFDSPIAERFSRLLRRDAGKVESTWK
ncbi:LysR family transcriptional regulator [Novosphingobium sp. BL-52-GroH]|uniref:LysR family transcriptional regulator n=1 Tax=Novosphingobium sp. BL-52-GroH TaxID=3349877 RepID=UPI00384ADDCD